MCLFQVKLILMNKHFQSICVLTWYAADIIFRGKSDRWCGVCIKIGTRCISKCPLLNPEDGSIAEFEKKKERALCSRKDGPCRIHTKIPNGTFLWKWSETGSLSFLCIPVYFARVYNSMFLKPVLQSSPSRRTKKNTGILELELSVVPHAVWRLPACYSILEFELSMVPHAVWRLPACYSIRSSVVIKRERRVCIFIRSME